MRLKELFTTPKLLIALLVLSMFPATPSQSQDPRRNIRYRVDGGVSRQVQRRPAGVYGYDVFTQADSLRADSLGMPLERLLEERIAEREQIMEVVRTLGDSLASDTLNIALPVLDSMVVRYRTDSLFLANLPVDRVRADSLGITMNELQALLETGYDFEYVEEEDSLAGLNKRQLRRLETRTRRAHPDFVRHNRFFADSVPISRLTAISIVVPGYSQLYNNQAWKIPVLYGTVGTTTYFWMNEQSKYKKLKKEYDALVWEGATQDEKNDVQIRMIRKNTSRQLLMAAAVGSYIYFLGDGVVNYPGQLTQVKKATTLSTIFPGAGQIYNGSYWKVPIVLGGFATMAMTIDWNNRGYQRFKTAYDIRTKTPTGQKPKDEFAGWLTEEAIKNYKNSYRRNRDLCIILTGAVYLLNVIDAHVDAHMKDYDVSDKLAFNFTPVIMDTYLTSGRGSRNSLGFAFSINF